jgi:AcrR family transcriptional regulator
MAHNSPNLKTTQQLGCLEKQKMAQMDRRVARTRRLLAQALMELVDEKSYDDITIREITDHADIGYATFFRHYDGKDDLMLEVFTQIVTELEALQESHAIGSFEEEGYHLFQHVAEHTALYRSILDSRYFARKLREHMAAIVLGHLEQHSSELIDSPIPVEIAAQHMVSSVLGLTDWWLDNDRPYSVEQMAMFYERLVVQATWYAMTPDGTTARDEA